MTQIRIPKPTLADLAAALLIVAGLILRVRQYLSGRALWLDEAMLALNIVNRDFLGLLKPLDYDQGAPLGFLLLEKLTITLLGNGQLTLRLPSVVAGCLALVLFYLLLRRFLSPAGVLPALALFAFSERLIYYTSELKQYIFDVFSILMVLCVFAYFSPRPDEPSPAGRRWLPMLLAGILAVWFSHPVVFALAGVGMALLWQNRRNRYQLTQAGLVIAGWLVSFGGVFLVSLNDLASNPFLMAYWQDYFMPMPPWSNPGWVLETFIGMFSSFALRIPPWLALGLLLAGFAFLFRKNSALGLALALTIVAAFGASALGKYPLGGRMLVFAAPLSLAVVGAAFAGLYGLLERVRWVAVLMVLSLALVVLFEPVTRSLDLFLSPKMQENMHPALQQLRGRYQADDLIYVYYGGMPAFRYYAPFYGFSEGQFTAGEMSYYHLLEPTLADIESLRGNARVWILFSHVYAERGIDEREAVLAYIDEQNLGKCRVESREPGTSVFLYLCDFAN
jgi:uncharacterized membrane protein